jgi:hypothetical protein
LLRIGEGTERRRIELVLRSSELHRDAERPAEVHEAGGAVAGFADHDPSTVRFPPAFDVGEKPAVKLARHGRFVRFAGYDLCSDPDVRGSRGSSSLAASAVARSLSLKVIPNHTDAGRNS